MIIKAHFDQMVAKDKKTGSAPYVEVLCHELNDVFTAWHDVPPNTYSASEGIIQNVVMQGETKRDVDVGLDNLEGGGGDGKKKCIFKQIFYNDCAMFVHEYLELTGNK